MSNERSTVGDIHLMRNQWEPEHSLAVLVHCISFLGRDRESCLSNKLEDLNQHTVEPLRLSLVEVSFNLISNCTSPLRCPVLLTFSVVKRIKERNEHSRVRVFWTFQAHHDKVVVSATANSESKSLVVHEVTCNSSHVINPIGL